MSCNGVSASNPLRALYDAAKEESEDMMCLNDKLADVFQKLSKMRNKDNGDSGPYLNTIACMEEEVKKLKMAYECELSKLRQVI